MQQSKHFDQCNPLSHLRQAIEEKEDIYFTVEIQEDLHSPILSNPNLDLPGCRPDRTSPTDGEKLKEIRILQIIGHR
jgi:hypothetical protein